MANIYGKFRADSHFDFRSKEDLQWTNYSQKVKNSTTSLWR